MIADIFKEVFPEHVGAVAIFLKLLKIEYSIEEILDPVAAKTLVKTAIQYRAGNKVLNCSTVKQFIEKPDYSSAILAYIAIKYYEKTGKCYETMFSLEKLNRKTYENTVKTIEKIKKLGYRIEAVLPDIDIVVIKANAGCGKFTVTCNPVRCHVTEVENVDVDENSYVAICNDKPPYFDFDAIKEETG